MFSSLFADDLKSQDLHLKMNLKLEQSGLKESLLAIEKKTGVRFMLPEAVLANVSKSITLHRENISVKDALTLIFAGTTLNTAP